MSKYGRDKKEVQNYNILASNPDGERETGDFGTDKNKLNINLKEMG